MDQLILKIAVIQEAFRVSWKTHYWEEKLIMYMNGCFKESTWLFKAFMGLIYEPRHSFDLRLPMSFTGLVMFTALRIT